MSETAVALPIGEKTKVENLRISPRSIINDDDDYEIVEAKPWDFDEIHRFILGDFRRSEPLNAALRLSESEARDFFAESVKCSLNDGVSFVVRRRNNDEKGIVGVRLACIIDRNQGIEPFQNDDPNSSSNIKKLKALLYAISSQVGLLGGRRENKKLVKTYIQ